ncbi:MAG: NYN domain-containing protein, partial [Limisphaerales bacterium]
MSTATGGSGTAPQAKRCQIVLFQVPDAIKEIETNDGIDSNDGRRYSFLMALARILVDGYSLLHNWPGLAAGQPRHSERARDELIRVLAQYQDVTGDPVTVFFDGAGPSVS